MMPLFFRSQNRTSTPNSSKQSSRTRTASSDVDCGTPAYTGDGIQPHGTGEIERELRQIDCALSRTGYSLAHEDLLLARAREFLCQQHQIITCGSVNNPCSWNRTGGLSTRPHFQLENASLSPDCSNSSTMGNCSTIRQSASKGSYCASQWFRWYPTFRFLLTSLPIRTNGPAVMEAST